MAGWEQRHGVSLLRPKYPVIEAMRDFPEAHLLIAGDGPEMDALRNLVDE